MSPQRDYNDTENEEIFNSKNSQIERNLQHTSCILVGVSVQGKTYWGKRNLGDLHN